MISMHLRSQTLALGLGASDNVHTVHCLSTIRQQGRLPLKVEWPWPLWLLYSLDKCMQLACKIPWLQINDVSGRAVFPYLGFGSVLIFSTILLSTPGSVPSNSGCFISCNMQKGTSKFRWHNKWHLRILRVCLKLWQKLRAPKVNNNVRVYLIFSPSKHSVKLEPSVVYGIHMCTWH